MQALKDDLRGAALTAYSGAPGAPRAAACSAPWHLGSASGACPASVCVKSPILMLGLVGSRDGNQYVSQEGVLRVLWAWLGFHRQPKRHPVLTPAASSWCICWERAQLHWHQPRINVAKSGSSIQLSALGPPQELQEGCFPLGYPARRCPHLWADGAADTRTGAGGGKFLPPCAPALISWPPWARDRFPLSANISHKTIQLCP